MKKSTILLSLLLGGCVTAEKEEDRGMCEKYMTISERKIKCTGGRGVAPQFCIEEIVPKLVCVKRGVLN